MTSAAPDSASSFPKIAAKPDDDRDESQRRADAFLKRPDRGGGRHARTKRQDERDERQREEGVESTPSDQQDERQHGERGQEGETHRVRRVHEATSDRQPALARRDPPAIDRALAPHDHRLAMQRHGRADVPGDPV